MSSQGLQKAAVQPNNLKKVLAARWQGGNYSSRIWANKEKLSGLLKQTITSGLHRGLSVPKMSKLINDKMNAGIINAERLVRTEMNFVQNHAAKDSLQAAGLDEYEFIAVLDHRTTPRCQALDGTMHLIEEYSVGTNAPPMHPRCRSTISAVLGEKTGTRIARNKEGKNIQVPASMTYPDYKKVYLDKSMTLEKWREKDNTRAKSQYESPKEITRREKERDVIRRLANGEKVTPILPRPENEPKILQQFNLYDKLTKTDAQMLAQVNPNYSTGEYKWVHNCQKCVVAWELLHRGYDVTAKPFNINDLIGNSTIAAWKINGGFYTDPDIKWDFSKFELKKVLEKSFEEWGNNARAVIRIKRINGTTHAFTARFNNGNVIYEDPQINKVVNIDDILKDITLIKGKNWFMRVDNRGFSDVLGDAVQNRMDGNG